MHARDLVELATIVAIHGPAVVEGPEEGPEEAIQQYWVASKCRLDRWGRGLRRLTDETKGTGRRGPRLDAARARAMLDEILASEVLTRVWAALMSAHDRRRDSDRMEPIARSVLIGHSEARHRALLLLVDGRGFPAEESIKLNQVRMRADRWSDVLIGCLARRFDVTSLAVDPQRARDFAEDFQCQERQGSRVMWPLLLASLRAAFCEVLAPASPNADLNEKIAAGVLAFFEPECLSGTPLFHSFWLHRLASMTNDAQGMIDELLAGGPHLQGDEPNWSVKRFRDRLRRLGSG